MARGAGRGASALHELHHNGEPPQPTLAAQLANRIANREQQPRNQDEETFKQLLREVFESEDESSNTAKSVGDTPEVSYKLIYVIAKAGLDCVSQSNPFTWRKLPIARAAESLRAISITLRRTPQVLFAPAYPNVGYSRTNIPLLLWLVPKILTLMIIEDDKDTKDLKARCDHFLELAIVSEKKIHLKDLKYRFLFRYLQGCIEDILSKLEDSELNILRNPTFSCNVPSHDTIQSIFPYHDSQAHQQNPVAIFVKAPKTALTVVLRLLKILLDDITSGWENSSILVPNQTSLQWLHQSLSRVWNVVSLESDQYNTSLLPTASLELFSDLARSILQQSFVHRHKQVTRTIFQSISIILLSSPLPFTKSLEHSISLTLLELNSIMFTTPNTDPILDDSTFHLLRKATEDVSRIRTMDRDLQQIVSFLVNNIKRAAADLSPTDDAVEKPTFENILLRKTYSSLFADDHNLFIDPGEFRPQKRARSVPVLRENLRENTTKTLYVALGSEPSIELHGLSSLASEMFPKLPENEQCHVFQILGSLACIIACNQTEHRGHRFVCSHCDGEAKNETHASAPDSEDFDEIMSTFVNLTQAPRSPRYRRPRVAAMLTALRLLAHTSKKDNLDLGNFSVGQMCLGGLHSSVRELRVAAGRTLSVFLRETAGHDLAVKNRLVALDYLRGLSGQSDITLQETSILAWGQVARSMGDGDELNLVLLKLVEYLGHTNPLLCDIAYDELQNITNHSPNTAMKLFAPYWRTIAVTVVGDIRRRPQKVHKLSDLLDMRVPDFLVLTQVHTIPYFVSSRKREILQLIADASGQSVMALCREHANMAAVLSSILMQSPTDADSLVTSLLNSVSPEFSHVDCAELMRSEPQTTATELLKLAGDEDGTRRPVAERGLHFLANSTRGKSLSSRGTGKPDAIGLFFETHVLGIMALLADTINGGKGPQPMLEKIRCLRAIREMTRIARGFIGSGLPQICACLRSAIENKELANEGFQAWIVMMSLLSEDDIGALVDPTFAIIVQYWPFFHGNTQKQAYDMVSHILKTHQPMIRDIVNTLPSLASVPLMAKFEEELGKLKAQMDVKRHFEAFCERCHSESALVIDRALTELATYLEDHQSFLHESANSEQPDSVVGKLTRCLLDTSVSFSSSNMDIAILCARCLGMVGCLDPTRIEAVREKKDILVLSNFRRDDEICDFIVFFLKEVLVKAFLSATNSRSQGFLAYAMQQLLAIGDFEHSVRSKDPPFDDNYRRWFELPESIRTLLTPFLDSKYFIKGGVSKPRATYPMFKGDMSHAQWLRSFTFDLLQRNGRESGMPTVLLVLSRIIRAQDTSIASFLIPFAVLDVVIEGSDQEKEDVAHELLAILAHPLSDNQLARDTTILCSQTVFEILDYLSRWMQEKKKEIVNMRSSGTRASRGPSEAELERQIIHISSVEAILLLIPADVISTRAVECKSYARALFHWEQYIRQQRHLSINTDNRIDLEPYYERLQDIYTQIDEPDGIEGISVHLQVLNIDQQILEHRKAGRWTAAQSWYEMLHTEQPDDLDIQYNLLTSLKESGQHDVLLNQVDSFRDTPASKSLSLPFATEASWVTGKWEKLRKYVTQNTAQDADFNIGIGHALLALSAKQTETFGLVLKQLRTKISRSLSLTNTASLQECHEAMLKYHVLAEMEAVSGASGIEKLKDFDKASFVRSLDQRLDILGPFFSHKQYILGLRRATMHLSMREFSRLDVASAWLTSAKLARKGDFTHQAFNAVLHASQLGDPSATIEHSRLLWAAGNHRKAIKSLEGAIAKNTFRSRDYVETGDSIATNNPEKDQQQNLLKAKAHLLLAKWLDRAGQTQSEDIIAQYKKAVLFQNRWERGHYHLGKHYNKLLESEKAKPLPKQAQTYITGETTKLVVENYLRALAFGAKYIYQTMPRALTLWLDLGAEGEAPLDHEYGDEAFRTHIVAQRRKILHTLNSQVKKYIDRLPAWAFYTALSQLVARICHPSHIISGLLIDTVVKVTVQHTPQALWTLLAMVKSSNRDRATRGLACMNRIYDHAKKPKSDTAGADLRSLVNQSQKLSDQLLRVCEGEIQGKPSNISISKDLGFNHKTAMSRLAMPVEVGLTASLPTSENVNLRSHKAFNSSGYVHISSFLDDVLVLNSLQRPRKISIRGSDGHIYALLCKPKDDLRKDQRLMEFNAMINRALKKDAESSKRRLYIKTYAVTPLNEECGLIEWIDNLKTLREILLNTYKQKNIHINYSDIRLLLNESISHPDKLQIFTKKILSHFSPVFHEWFVEMFPEPGSWFTARLRYARSCAVMSIVGHVLGLGDRHGENILFEEGNGGTFHVDFNCLFDKGLTFEKPELVPFRLTHNMVDAFGAYGYEGPFRKSCELTDRILRQHEDTLMTILETFLYDPTTDFLGKKKKRESVVPDTPKGVLENIRTKVRGLLPGESVPLSVEGYVDELIKQATDPFKLASMYIGWCAFF